MNSAISNVESRVPRLTPTQKRLLDTLAQGDTTKDVALELGVTQRNVDYILQRIYKILGVETLHGAVVKYKVYCLTRDFFTTMDNIGKK